MIKNRKTTIPGKIESRLLERYFSDRRQINLFEIGNLSSHNLIDKAYKNRNTEIGYIMEGEQE